MREFAGKVAVVTGAASGIGYALAARFGREGMKVVLADVDQETLDAATQRLRHQDYDALGVRTDVSKPEAVEELARKTLAAYGKVHILCNNAGVGGAGPATFWDATLNDWQYVLGVNLWGVIHGLRTFVPIMIAQDEEGHVVNTASVGGLVLGSGIYGTTKHAVVALTEALHIQFLHKYPKLKASVLCPGYIATHLAVTTVQNRPPELQNPAAPAGQAASDRPATDGPTRILMDPEQVAPTVLDAIRDEQLYILTHSDFDDLIRTRMDNILDRRNPDLETARAMRARQRA
jgi:NAD(P)-dependent dehydrogenase (short-subunit alcohol dehydrogenase family)